MEACSAPGTLCPSCAGAFGPAGGGRESEEEFGELPPDVVNDILEECEAEAKCSSSESEHEMPQIKCARRAYF